MSDALIEGLPTGLLCLSVLHSHITERGVIAAATKFATLHHFHVFSTTLHLSPVGLHYVASRFSDIK